MLPIDPYEKYKRMLPPYLRKREQAVILREIILSGKQWLSFDTLVELVQKYGLSRWEAEKAVMDLAFVGVRRGYSRSGVFNRVMNQWYDSNNADVVVRVLDEMLASPVFGVYVEMIKASEAMPKEVPSAEFPVRAAPVKEEKKMRMVRKLYAWKLAKLRRFFQAKRNG